MGDLGLVRKLEKLKTQFLGRVEPFDATINIEKSKG